MSDQVLSFAETLPYMAKGMAGIFIVMFILMAVIAILNVTTRSKEDEQ